MFTFGGDPVKAGFVASFNKPGANVTGVSWFGSNLAAKNLELLLQVVPDAAVVALLLNPNNPEIALQPQEFEQAARRLNCQFVILNASSEAEIISSFAALVERRAGALVEVPIRSCSADDSRSSRWPPAARYRRSTRTGSPLRRVG